ncbi:SDR family NAD(P)-dependent oxidoreductase [Ferrovibrio sp. MS7]|jgi:NAD(P)-dependent dehydrogenase (short-subunit alcohol dehydrogenase family)|uniref:SDR family NAD(P)-dependent oxidoreductase n=1 Tax=Ferrovibrio plantarum TaxID=3119164 RepID=UPI00313714A2
MAIDFQGRVAIVTGAGSGLGRSHALALAARGARVVVNDLGGAVDGTGGSAKAADQVVAEIKAAGGEAVANHDSVSDAAGAARIVQAAMDAWDRVDVLVNNAGILRDKSFAKMELGDFDTVVDVHLLGSAYVTKAAWPVMQAQNYGRIVMTTSAAGLYGNFGQTNYAAAKLGLVGLMNALKQEGAKNGILVNTIAPVAATRMTEALFPPALLPHLKPEYITAAVVYLCSEACNATGDIVSAGAGFYAKAQVVESEGVFFGAGSSVSPEMIAENYGRITDMSQARAYAAAMEEVAKIFGFFQKK